MFRRLLAAVVIVVVAGILLLAGWPQLIGVQRFDGIAQVVSLRGAAIAAAAAAIVLALLLSLLVRPFRALGASLCVLLLVFIGVSGAVLATRGFGPGTIAPADARPEGAITVLAWNTLGPATTPEEVASLALELDAQVVALPETQREDAIDAAVRMREAGSPMWVLTSAYDPFLPARSTSLLVSVDLGEYVHDETERTTSVLPSLVATPANGDGPTFVAVHAVSPIQGQMDNWRSDLSLLSELCTGDEVIMAGDFNATVDHFAGLGSPGAGSGRAERVASAARLGDCTDAATAAGVGAVGTWPTVAPALLGAPIDHVMVGDAWRVESFHVVEDRDGAGSDHRPVVSVLAPAEP